MFAPLAPRKRQMLPHAACALFALAFTTVMCSASDESPACWPPEAETSSDDPEGFGCAPERAGQVCDRATQRCESVCEPNAYLLVCRARPAMVGSPIASPVDALRAPDVAAGG